MRSRAVRIPRTVRVLVLFWICKSSIPGLKPDILKMGIYVSKATRESIIIALFNLHSPFVSFRPIGFLVGPYMIAIYIVKAYK